MVSVRLILQHIDRCFLDTREIDEAYNSFIVEITEFMDAHIPIQKVGE